jgi:xylan 1,4-beta-xylosidase
METQDPMEDSLRHCNLNPRRRAYPGRLGAIVTMAGALCLAHGQISPPSERGPYREIRADLTGVRGPMSRMYNFCVGAGRANEGLRADWQRQLLKARAECGFRYIRFHGLFDDDMGVYQEDEHGVSVYNWQYVDELFDFLQRIGMKPFVELGFMPSALASGSNTIFWYRANVTPPKDYAKWEKFIAAFARHVTERYGAEEVRSWYFEVWNEPNLIGFWTGSSGGKSYKEFEPILRAKYYELYEATARAIKTVDPHYRVGGPATAGSGWIDETLRYFSDRHLPLDFVSTHSYATTTGYLDEHGNVGTVFSPDRNAITKEVKEVRARMDRSPFAGAELHYTEWSSSYTPTDPIHDSYHSAAFILDKIRNIGRSANSMSYWTFTDIFEEAGPRMTPFHGGFGLFNYQDLPKPSYFAYKFLNQLGDVELASSDPASFICRSGDGNVQALFWDFTITRPDSAANDQVFYRTDQPAKAKGLVRLWLSGLQRGQYDLVAYRVGYRSNDVQSAWRNLGSPAQLSRNQVELLRQASSGVATVNDPIEVDNGGRFAREFKMRENDVWLVKLERTTGGAK